MTFGGDGSGHGPGVMEVGKQSRQTWLGKGGRKHL